MMRILASLLCAVGCLSAVEPALIPFGTGSVYAPGPITPAHATSRDVDLAAACVVYAAAHPEMMHQ